MTESKLQSDRQQEGLPPEQTEMAIRVHGESMNELPKDLYIPPDALEVILEAFEGPLDLLLYLIKRQNMDILDISVSEITHQYVRYIQMMTEMRFELAAEYLLMAAMLAEIKSRMLLPKRESDEEDEDDPRAELVRRLQQYERYKKAAQDIDALPRLERDIRPTNIEFAGEKPEIAQPDIELKELLLAFKDVLQRADMFQKHQVDSEPLSMRERMGQVLAQLESALADGRDFIEFSLLFTVEEGKQGVIVSFIATLELLKEGLIDIVQAQPYSPLHIRAALHSQEKVEPPASNQLNLS